MEPYYMDIESLVLEIETIIQKSKEVMNHFSKRNSASAI